MKFELNEAQLAKLKPWCEEQDQKTLAKQRLRENPDPFLAYCNESDIPYYGAIGGELTFKFTPTSIGDIVIVYHSNGAELDLSAEGGFG